MLGERGQDRQRALLALAKAEQAGQLLADQLRRDPPDRGGGAGGKLGEGAANRRSPTSVGGGAQEIGLALGGLRRRGALGRAAGPRR